MNLKNESKSKTRKLLERKFWKAGGWDRRGIKE